MATRVRAGIMLTSSIIFLCRRTQQSTRNESLLDTRSMVSLLDMGGMSALRLFKKTNGFIRHDVCACVTYFFLKFERFKHMCVDDHFVVAKFATTKLDWIDAFLKKISMAYWIG